MGPLRLGPIQPSVCPTSAGARYRGGGVIRKVLLLPNAIFYGVSDSKHAIDLADFIGESLNDMAIPK